MTLFLANRKNKNLKKLLRNDSYIEYLPNNGEPAKWITTVNGLEKNNFNKRIQGISPWFHHEELRPERLSEVLSDRESIKEERYTKGNRSV